MTNFDPRVYTPPIHQKLSNANVSLVSNVGAVREENQDFMGFHSFGNVHLVVVADGMGGHSGGYEASRLAVSTIIGFVVQNFNQIEPKLLLEEAIKSANYALLEYSEVNPQYKGMGTTVVAALCFNNNVWLAHVGDSRAYVIRDKKIRLLSFDHTRVNSMLEAGLLSYEDVEDHPMGHILERCVGVHTEVLPEVRQEPIPLQKGDVLLLCSDGLWGTITETDIVRLIKQQETIQTASEGMINLSLERLADDNVTLGLFEYTAETADDIPLSKDVRDKYIQQKQAEPAIQTKQTRKIEEQGSNVKHVLTEPQIAEGTEQRPTQSKLVQHILIGTLIILILIIVDIFTTDFTKLRGVVSNPDAPGTEQPSEIENSVPKYIYGESEKNWFEAHCSKCQKDDCNQCSKQEVEDHCYDLSEALRDEQKEAFRNDCEKELEGKKKEVIAKNNREKLSHTQNPGKQNSYAYDEKEGKWLEECLKSEKRCSKEEIVKHCEDRSIGMKLRKRRAFRKDCEQFLVGKRETLLAEAAKNKSIPSETQPNAESTEPDGEGDENIEPRLAPQEDTASTKDDEDTGEGTTTEDTENETENEDKLKEVSAWLKVEIKECDKENAERKKEKCKDKLRAEIPEKCEKDEECIKELSGLLEAKKK